MNGEEDDIQYGDCTDERQPGGDLREDRPGLHWAGFDPTPDLRHLRGRGGTQDDPDVSFRLRWLRREHPDAEITTEHIRIDDQVAIFKATVSIPDGGKATGHGSETASDFPDYIEKAETKALGRALNALGYSAQFAEGDEESAPQPPNTKPDEAIPSAPAANRPSRVTPAPTVAQSVPDGRRAGIVAPPPTPMSIGVGRERASSQASAQRAPTSAPRPANANETEPPLEDYSWTAFWRWARERGYTRKDEVEAFIGQSITSLSPAAVRQLILARRGEA